VVYNGEGGRDVKKTYLGDGVYVVYDEAEGIDGIILTTEDGINVTNKIYLEGSVYENLIAFVGNLRESFRGTDENLSL
jgi:hypothetical protein